MDVDISAVLRCIGAATEHVLQSQPWGDAFKKTGFGNKQANVGPRVLDRLELDRAPLIPHTKPDVALVALCLPRGSSSAAKLMRPHEVTINPLGPSAAAEPIVAVPHVGQNEVSPGMMGRTRSQTRARSLIPSHARSEARIASNCVSPHASNIRRRSSRAGDAHTRAEVSARSKVRPRGTLIDCSDCRFVVEAKIAFIP